MFLGYKVVIEECGLSNWLWYRAGKPESHLILLWCWHKIKSLRNSVFMQIQSPLHRPRASVLASCTTLRAKIHWKTYFQTCSICLHILVCKTLIVSKCFQIGPADHLGWQLQHGMQWLQCNPWTVKVRSLKVFVLVTGRLTLLLLVSENIRERICTFVKDKILFV